MTWRGLRQESRLHRDIRRLRPFAGVDLLAVGGLHAGDLEAAVGADHGEAVGFYRGDLAGLAGDALRVLRRQRLGVENLELLAVERTPGAGRRVAAADQPVDLLPRLAPIDPGVVGAAAAFVGRQRLVLLDARRLAGLHQVDRLHHGVDAHREQPVEIHGAERVGAADRRFLLQQHVAGIEAVVRPEDRQTGFLLALDDRPVDRRRAAIGRQQRRVILDRAVRRDVEEFFRHEQRDEGHDLEVGLERLELLPDFRVLVGRRLIDRQLRRDRGFLQRIGLGAFFFRRDIDADDVLAALDQRLQHGLAEGLLAVNHDTHTTFSQNLCCHARDRRASSNHATSAITGSPLSRGRQSVATPPRPSPACPAA